MDAREIAKDLVECYHRFSDPSHTFNTLEDLQIPERTKTVVLGVARCLTAFLISWLAIRKIFETMDLNSSWNETCVYMQFHSATTIKNSDVTGPYAGFFG
jgi:hypothetical protein